LIYLSFSTTTTNVALAFGLIGIYALEVLRNRKTIREIGKKI
jgi:hypothetical protein